MSRRGWGVEDLDDPLGDAELRSRYPGLEGLTGSQRADFQRARRSVLRSTAIWTPAFAALLAGAVYLLVTALEGEGGAWFGFSLLGLMGVLSGFSALSAWRDLFAEPVETSAEVARKWRKFDLLLFFRAHYVLLSRRVFRVTREVFDEIPEVGGWIYVLHYPHTNALVAWRPLSREELPHEIQAEREAMERQLEAERLAAEAEAKQANQAEQVDLPEFGGRREE